MERGSSPKRRRVAGGTESRPNDPRSIKNLEVDLEKLDQNWLGRIIPPQGSNKLWNSRFTCFNVSILMGDTNILDVRRKNCGCEE